ncbi:MAG: DNA recombination protein RmuC, partial [Ghiorsea sp.]|nr:DNA recombination protein RmuC [Ghiorsea sp.]
MDILQNILWVFGIFFILLTPWFIITYRKKDKLENLSQASSELRQKLETNLSESQLELTTLKTQFDEKKLQHVALAQQLEHKNEQLEKADMLQQQQDKQIIALRDKHQQLSHTFTKLQTEHEQAQKHHADKLALLEDAKEKLAQEFKLVANQIFEEKQSKMTATSKETLHDIIKPMQKDMSEFRARIDQVHKEDIEARTSLGHHLNDLKALNQQMSQDALNLTQALKSDSKVQGNWGELILEKLLESSGLREGFEFDREKSFKNDDGQRQRPDVIINMPGKKHVIIDAKVSLTDYERAMSATDKLEKEVAIKAHVKSLQSHIQLLSAKDYNHIHEINSPDYVLMFVPIEG